MVADNWFDGMVKHCVQHSILINFIRRVVRDFPVYMYQLVWLSNGLLVWCGVSTSSSEYTGVYITKQHAHYSGMSETC